MDGTVWGGMGGVGEGGGGGSGGLLLLFVLFCCVLFFLNMKNTREFQSYSTDEC